MEYDLSPEEIRVLGALMEKENTTPDYYPLTLNALVNACNQKSNRDPVVHFDERATLHAIDALRDRGFATRVQLADSRVPKFEQRITKTLDLTIQEAAVLCILMLRGPQTMGEIRGRTTRFYPFETMEEVTISLEDLMQKKTGSLVARLPIQPGRKEARYAHLLSGEATLPEEPTWTAKEQAPAMEPPLARPISDETLSALEDLREEVADLKENVANMRRELEAFKAQFE